MRTEYSDEIMNFSNWKISLNFTPHSGTCSFWVNTIEIKMSTQVSSYIWLPPTRCRLFFLKQGRYVWLGTIRFVGLRLCIFLSFLPSSKLNLQNNSQWPSQPQSCHLGYYGSTYFLIGPEKSHSCGFCMHSYPPCFQSSLLVICLLQKTCIHICFH